ncbi:MAG: peptidase T [Firmicutes bacterium]|nr:peptidase T [Bacillota bacterium]
MDIVERFLKYVSFETTSDEHSESCPSSPKELELAKYIAGELKSLGLEDARMDENGYVYASLPASEGCEDRDVIGLIAHMDTSPDAPGANIKTRQFRYEGGDITLNERVSISAKEFDLDYFIGQELIVTDGTTLLGADDKAGAAEIVSAVEYLLEHPEVKHGKVLVAFTPDEEIGRGTDRFDLEHFPAKYAYTLDGGRIDSIEYECFNAASCRVVVNGLNIHPGAAKNKMKNSLLIANEFISMLPPAETPAHTEGYEGFYHVAEMCGDETQTSISIIIRDHDRDKFEARKNYVLHAASYLNEKYGKDTVVVSLRDSYYNMREKLEPCMYIVDRAIKAFNELGIDIQPNPIRGGTDGAQLSYKGLPCPNLPTGGENYHSVKEFVSVDAMRMMIKVVVKIVSAV